MLTRRLILTSSLALLGGCAARAVTTPTPPPPTDGSGGGGGSSPPAGAPPLVAPHANWTGAPGSGGAAPTDPVRTTAKPAVHWWTVPFQAMATNTVVGVDADALGGIAYVDFWVDGTVQRITTPSVYTDTDATGVSRARLGYWITLDITGPAAAHGTGTIDIYATAVANDTRMQPRVIGGPSNSAGAGVRPMQVYPRTSAHDYSVTVAPSGADYTTLKGALDYLQSVGAKRGRVTFNATGFYELHDRTSNYNGGVGYTTITHAPGVVATLGRAAAYAPTAPSSWNWQPQFERIEFRGSGIVFDQRNFTVTVNYSPYWYNGCKFTNSIGTRDTFYFNKGAHPGCGPSTPAYWTDATLEYLPSPFLSQPMATGIKQHYVFTDLFSGTHFVANTFTRDHNTAFFTDALPGLSIGYAGSASAATVESTGNALILREAGSVVATISYSQYPTTAANTAWAISELATKIAARAGWTATTINDGRSAYYLEASGQANVKGATVTLSTRHDIHADWWQGYGGNRENIIIRNNTCLDAKNFNATLNNDAVSQKDMVVKGNVFLGVYGPLYLGGDTMHHYLYENNTAANSIIMISNAGAGDPVYSAIRQNVVGGLYNNSTNAWPTLSFTENVFIIGNPTNPLTAYPNNTVVSSQSGLLMNVANDPRPTGALVLANNLKPRIDPLDGRLLGRAASDAVGAWAMGYSAPSYPF